MKNRIWMWRFGKGCCLYRSRFGYGYVPHGSFGKDKSLINSVKNISLKKISPPLQGLFFQEEIEDSKKLLEDVYVNDGTTGGSKKEVDRMIGTKLLDGSFSGTIPSMMKKVGLKLKTIITSHSQELCPNSLIDFLVISMTRYRILSVSNSLSTPPRKERVPRSSLILPSKMSNPSSTLLRL